MSKWGIEEQETLNAIKKIGFRGKLLNIAAGDGRFNNKLLEIADSLTAIDISEDELELLKKECPNNLKSKLSVKKVDITEYLPFKDETFDGIFCTGTLHLFGKEQLKKILIEIKRVLKPDGKLVLDFATDIKRLDDSNNLVIFPGEESYSFEEATTLLKKLLKDFKLTIEDSIFTEENLDSTTTGYKYITGKFLVISGIKK